MAKTKTVPPVVWRLVDKYMGILDIKGKRPTAVTIKNNLGSDWLGQTRWSSARPDETEIDLQEIILFDERKLEQVIAHEMVHHKNYLEMTETDLRRIKLGIMPMAHGRDFRDGAAMVNAVMGADFVTEKSDSNYDKSSNTREFYVLIMKPYYFDPKRMELGWAWAARLSPKIEEKIRRRRKEEGAKLVRSTDLRWTRGAKLGQLGMSLPHASQEAALRELYENGEEVLI